MNAPLSFVAIADAHTQGGNLKFLPRIVDRINGLALGAGSGCGAGAQALPPPPAPATEPGAAQVRALQPDFAISLGDCVYGLRENDVLADVRAYQAEISRLRLPHYYGVGNHEIEPIEVFGNLTWEDLLAAWELPERWYSFDVRGFHCCVLDAWLSLQKPRYAPVLERQVQWLAADLAASSGPTLIFTHEAIGFQQPDCPHWVAENNCNFWPPDNPFLELILAHRSRILAVFEGHKHKSLHKVIEGVSFHLVGAALRHGGQIAQVTVAPDGECRVQALPEWGYQDAGKTVQQTYRIRP